jgi:hypothetical protein
VKIHVGLYGDNRSPDFTGFAKAASLAAGEDLTDLFRRHGTTVGDLGLPKDREAIRKLADDLIKAAEREKEEWAEYRRLQGMLADDAWVREWTLEDNLPGNDPRAAWIDKLREPPERFQYLKANKPIRRYPWEQPRRGFLVLHPREKDVPSRLSRSFDVPEDGRTTIYLGAMLRPAGAPVALRLIVDEQVQWMSVLRVKLQPIAASVDLTPLAGKRVSIRLETDSQGEWGYREVLLDYLTIRTTTGDVTAAETPSTATPEPPKQDRAALFRWKDKNRDGKLTRDEFLANHPLPAKAPAFFARMDENHDGAISEPEFINAFNR